MHKVCLIITGGTVLDSDGKLLAVKKESDVAAWLKAMPELSLVATQLKVEIFHAGSDADLSPDVWLKTARYIYKERDNYSGFIILSSINNIPYFAEAISLMIENSDKPIVFTGSQLPDYLLNDDSGLQDILEESRDVGIRANLINCLQVVASRINGINIMFGDKLITGSGINLNQPLLAIPYSFRPDQIVGNVEFSIKLTPQAEERLTKYAAGPVRLHDHLEANVRYYELTPIFSQLNLSGALNDCKGALFYLPPTVAYPASIQKYLQTQTSKIPIIFCGRSFILPSLERQQSIKLELEKLGILLIPEENKEQLLVKFMWMLGKTKDLSKIKQQLSPEV